MTSYLVTGISGWKNSRELSRHRHFLDTLPLPSKFVIDISIISKYVSRSECVNQF